MGLKAYKTRIKKQMKTAGTYHPRWDITIDILAHMLQQYDALNETFVESGMQYAEHTAAGSKKAPIVTTMEKLRTDILQYQNALGLTPLGAKKLDLQEQTPKSNMLAEALMALRDDSG